MQDGTVPLDLIVQSASFLRSWQLIPGETALHFVRLDFDQDLSARTFRGRILPSGDDASIRLQMQGKKGFSIPWEEIEAVHLRFQAVGSKPNDDTFGTLKIRTKDKRRRFHLIRRGMMPEDVIAFFAPVADRVSADLRRYEREIAEMERDEIAEKQRAQKRNPTLVKPFLVLRYALFLSPAAMFLQLTAMPYDLYLAILTALALLPIALCIFLPQYFSIAEEFALRRQCRQDSPRGSLTMLIVLGGFVPSLGWTLDFNVMNWGWAIVVLALFGVTMAILMTRGERGNRIWINRAALSLLVAAFSLGTVLNLNYLLDFREPTVTEATITGMQIRGAGRSATYQLYFDALPAPVDVTRPEYETLEHGDTVVLVEHSGAFGIRCVEAWTMEEWNADVE